MYRLITNVVLGRLYEVDIVVGGRVPRRNYAVLLRQVMDALLADVQRNVRGSLVVVNGRPVAIGVICKQYYDMIQPDADCEPSGWYSMMVRFSMPSASGSSMGAFGYPSVCQAPDKQAISCTKASRWAIRCVRVES